MFILFAASFTKLRTERDWRSLGAFSAFILALFTEMCGFPLTIYLLSGWLGRLFPNVDFGSHDAGHLFETLFGWRGHPHFGPFHVLSNVLIFGGLWLLAASCHVLHAAQRDNQLATNGPYAYVRHPQYDAFIIVMFGFLLQWPTLVTLVMFPLLVWVYVRLARREEAIARAEFGPAWESYARAVPTFLPRMGGSAGATRTQTGEFFDG